MKRVRRIMYASDFSPASRPAFKKAIELSKSSGARLLIALRAPTSISFQVAGETYTPSPMSGEMTGGRA